MRIAVIGSGALGGFYGAKLAHAGFDVHFLMRRDYHAVRQNGLTVKSYQGDFHLDHVNCYQNVADIGPADLIFIGLKTTANHHFKELVGPLVKPGSLALLAQNGLGGEEQLAALFGAHRVGGALAFLCSNRLEPGLIHHLDYGYLRIGNFQRPPDDTLRTVSDMMNHSGIECQVVDDLTLARWKKLVWNIPFNGLSALLDKQVNQIMADPVLYDHADSLMREVQAAAGANGLVIPDEFLATMMDYSAKMEPYYTSMHLDRRAGQPLETDAIVGEPLRRGRAQGLDLPEMQSLYQGLLALEHS